MEFGNIGVFLCNCGKTLNLDFRKISKELETLEEVAVVERVDRLCMEEGLAYIVDDLRRKELDKIVVAACSNKNQIFEDLGEEMGLDPLGVEVVNIREECAWVHDEKKSATQKAKFLVRNSIKRESKLPEIIEVKVEPSILIAGDIRALELAEDFADFDAEIHLLNEEPYFKRTSTDKDSYLPSSKGSIFEFQDARFHTNTLIKDVKGDLGDFTVDLEKGRHIDIVKCVDCGKCIESCEQKAISRAVDSVSPAYVIDEKCNNCGVCLSVCPTNAITLENESETIKVAQIISFYPLKPWEGVYCIDSKGNGEAAHAAALKAALNIKGYKKERLIESELERCANHALMEKKLDIKGCSYCVDKCAYFPISSGTVSDIACKGCGTCASACPQNALDLRLQSFEDLIKEVDNTLAALIKEKIILFSCAEGGYSTLRAAGMNQLKYPTAVPILVPCLGNVSDVHILRAFDVGAAGVALLGCGNDGCMYRNGFGQAGKSVAFAKKILGVLGIGEGRIRMLRGDGTNPERFTKQMKEFEGRLKESDKNLLRKKEPISLDSLDKKGSRKRELLHALISGFAGKTKVTDGRIEGNFPIGQVIVDEGECTLCGSCTYHCNTGAMRYEGDEILDIFNTHTYCIGCGICEDICPENAIKLEKVLDLAPFIGKEERKFDVKVINCSVCGKPLMAEAALNKLKTRLKKKELDMLQKCQGCIDKETVADIVGAKKDDIVLIQQGKMPWES
jgi:heterodisulfide reductase subunit A-like polyferredoxin/coenzyme F420-reducing hydrogenase delta subunit